MGTPWYAGPEVRKEQTFYASSDIYSVGASFADVLMARSGFTMQLIFPSEDHDNPDPSAACAELEPDSIFARLQTELRPNLKGGRSLFGSHKYGPRAFSRSLSHGAASVARGASGIFGRSRSSVSNSELPPELLELILELAHLLHHDFRQRPTAVALSDRDSVLDMLKSVFLATGRFLHETELEEHMLHFEALRENFHNSHIVTTCK